MKQWIFLLFLVAAANSGLALDGDLDTVLRKFDYTASEKKAIVAIFEDADSKGLNRSELIDLLKEQQLKSASFYETIEYLAKKEKEIYEVKKSGFPYLEKREIKYIAYYLIGSYSVQQFNGLTLLIKEKKVTAKDIEGLFQFHLTLTSYEVSLNDSFSILFSVLKNGYFGKTDLDAISGLYLKSRDLRLDRKIITRKLIGGLGRNQDLKNIIYEIKTSSRK